MYGQRVDKIWKLRGTAPQAGLRLCRLRRRGRIELARSWGTPMLEGRRALHARVLSNAHAGRNQSILQHDRRSRSTQIARPKVKSCRSCSNLPRILNTFPSAAQELLEDWLGCLATARDWTFLGAPSATVNFRRARARLKRHVAAGCDWRVRKAPARGRRLLSWPVTVGY